MTSELFFTAVPPKLTRRIIVALVLVAVFVIGFNLLWILTDQAPPLWDMAGHSFRSAHFYRLLIRPAWGELFFYPSIYPPLVYSLTGVGYLFLGFIDDLPQYSLQIFSLVLILATFGIARRLIGKNIAGIVAAVLVCLYSLLAHFMRIYDLDMPLTAMTALTIYLLIRTEGFHRRGWTTLLGLSLGLGLLTKWTFAIFALPSVVLVIFLVLINPFIVRKGRNLWNLAFLALPLLLIVITPWYAAHSELILKTAEATAGNGFSVPFADRWSWENLVYYVSQINYGLGLPLLLLSLVGLVALVRYTRRIESWILLTWLVVPYLIMTLAFVSKESRYILPLFPALAVIASAVVLFSAKRWLVVTTFVWIGAFGFFPWLDTSWGAGLTPWNNQNVPQPLRLYGFRPVTPEDPQYGFRQPTDYHQELKAVAAFMANDWRQVGQPTETALVAVVPNSLSSTAQQYQFFTELAGMRTDYSLSSQIRSNDENVDLISEADYVVTKTGEQGPTVWQGKVANIVAAEADPDSVFNQEFQLIGTATLHGVEQPDPEVRVYRNIRWATGQ